MRALLVALGPLAALTLIAPRARADSVAQACAAESEHGQEIRNEGKLRAARTHFLKCASTSCPAVIHQDCTAWLSELEQRIPTVVFSVRTADGEDVSDVRVSVGGELLVGRLDGRAVQVDPGEYVFRFERSNGDEVSQRVMVREGERGRPIAVVLPRRVEEVREPGPQKSNGPPLATWIFGGLSLGGFAAFTYLWFSAVGDAKDLKSTCEPRCVESDLDGPRRKALFADVALGVGIASALAAAGFYVFRPTASRAATTSIVPMSHGAALTASGSF